MTDRLRSPTPGGKQIFINILITIRSMTTHAEKTRATNNFSNAVSNWNFRFSQHTIKKWFTKNYTIRKGYKVTPVLIGTQSFKRTPPLSSGFPGPQRTPPARGGLQGSQRISPVGSGFRTGQITPPSAWGLPQGRGSGVGTPSISSQDSGIDGQMLRGGQVLSGSPQHTEHLVIEYLHYKEWDSKKWSFSKWRIGSRLQKRNWFLASERQRFSSSWRKNRKKRFIISTEYLRKSSFFKR